MHIQRRLVLASQSPRRILLLKQIGLDVDVIPSDVPEEFESHLTPKQNAAALALRKAENVGKNIEDAIVIGADTIVAVGDELLGKPESPDDAIRMLELLSGRTHTVYTGFSLVDRPSNQAFSDVESTSVTFRKLPREEIAEYVAGGSPLDKAGAYGIQDDYGAVFVTRIEGCFYNVVGFPLARFYMALLKFQSQMSQR
jgi:septum formation protein